LADHAVKKAFTLIELLVVIAIIAVLLGILLPALGSARSTARLVKSQANLRSLGQIQEVYASEHRESLMLPFQIKDYRPGGGIVQRGWGVVRKVGSDLPGLEFPYGGGGYNSPWYTEMYAFHWYSVIGGWLNQGDYASEVQFSPSDRVLINRVQDLQDDPPSGWTLDTGYWDCSYVLSPTIWFAPERYKDNRRPDARRYDPGESLARRNRMSQVSYPSQKVLMWERFDWTRRERTASYRNPALGVVDPIIFGEESFSPQWNNFDAQPSVATADGSVSRVTIKDIFQRMYDDDPNVARAYSPTDFWDCSYDALEYYSMHEDGFEIGVEASGMGGYPAFFWATRDGIRGRDFAR
jgi:prepilin-type N-terminal cleavage/methylation domain-containing protein